MLRKVSTIFVVAKPLVSSTGTIHIDKPVLEFYEYLKETILHNILLDWMVLQQLLFLYFSETCVVIFLTELTRRISSFLSICLNDFGTNNLRNKSWMYMESYLKDKSIDI